MGADVLQREQHPVGRKRPQEVPAWDHPAGRMPARLGQHDKENAGCGGRGHPRSVPAGLVPGSVGLGPHVLARPAAGVPLAGGS